MTCKNAKNIVSFGTIAMIAVIFIGFSDVYAEENEGYNMIGDVNPVLTFTFRDGIETHEFPVFKMGENFVANSGTTFSVEGVVTDSPLLHQAMDEAYKYRLVSGNGYEYSLKYFDVDVDFIKNGESIIMLDYNNCRIDNYQVETLDSNDYESYFKEIGFAIVDKLDFECSGVNFDQDVDLKSTSTSFTDFDQSEFKFANDMRTSVTFSFNGGMEKIEFPVFELVSGYEESTDLVTAEFALEGILNNYPLLYNAIDNSRKVSGLGTSYNTDFDALVEFTDGKKILRGFDFRGCLVSDAKITTQVDKEEGFTGKSGFAVVNQLNFRCSGFDALNMYYDDLRGDIPVWKTSYITNVYEEPIQNSANGLKTVTTFTFGNGIETSEFSMFSQSNVLTATEDVFISDKKNPNNDSFDRKATYPTFELRGIVGDYPMLYKSVDENRRILGVSGTQLRDLFDVDVNIMSDGKVIRGFNYSNCRTIDYVVITETNKDESYAKNKFALVNVLDFECQGYHPNNPIYDTMLNTYEKAKTTSTNDLRNTDDWGIGFTVQN